MTTVPAAIGLPPTNTIKLKQMASVRARAKMLGRGAKEETVRIQRKAAKAGGRGERQRRRSADAVAATAKECPRRVLLTAALAGDKDARWTAQQLFGDGWRKLAEREVGNV